MTSTAKGMLLMVVAMLIIPAGDALAKYLSNSLGIVQIVWLRSILQTLFLGMFIYFSNKRFERFHILYFYLALCLSICIFFLFWGLKYLPLANNIALFFVEPFILTILSIFFLKEKLTKAITITLIIGFIGTLIIIRPNWSAYGYAAIFPILAGSFYAIYLLILRISSNNDHNILTTQFWIGVISTLLLGIVLYLGSFTTFDIIQYKQITSNLLWILFIFGAITTIVHLSIAKAFSYAKPSVLASFQYLEIISATLLGWLFFKDIPDMLTIIGAIIVVIAGLNLVYFEREKKNS